MYGFNHDAAWVAKDKVQELLGQSINRRPIQVCLEITLKTGTAAVRVTTNTPDDAAHVERCQLPEQIDGFPVKHLDISSIKFGSSSRSPELTGATP